VNKRGICLSQTKLNNEIKNQRMKMKFNKRVVFNLHCFKALTLASVFFILHFLISCQSVPNNEAIIQGRIITSRPDRITYTSPVNGVSYWGFKDQIEPYEDAGFQVTLHIQKPAIIHFMSYYRQQAFMIVEPGHKYKVDFNTTDDGDFFVIDSKDKEGQLYFNQLSLSRDYSKDVERLGGWQHVGLLINNAATNRAEDNSAFQEMLKKGKISDDFYRTATNNIACYYTLVKGYAASFAFFTQFRLKNGCYTTKIDSMWKSNYPDASSGIDDLKQSQWAYFLLENYLQQKEYTAPDFSSDTIFKYYESGKIHTHNINIAGKYLSEPDLEYYYAAYLFHSCEQMKYEKELISLYHKFRQTYPRSLYLPYVEKAIQPVFSYYEMADSSRNKQIHFLQNAENINTLKEAVRKLNAEKVYVDVWATWCAPCQKEFEYNKQLQKLLKSEDTNILYISIDRPGNEEKMKEVARAYNLEGYHLRANEKLVNDLRKLFDKKDQLKIPWYILMDGNGDLIRKHASRPSEIEKLKMELRE